MQMSVQSQLSEEEELVGHEVIACALAVHRDLGPGYLESFYRKAMCIELRSRALAFETEKAVEVQYRGEVLGTHRIDLIVQGLVIVELKAVSGRAIAERGVRRRRRASGAEHAAWSFASVGKDLVRHDPSPGLPGAEHRTAKRIEQTMLRARDKARRKRLR